MGNGSSSHAKPPPLQWSSEPQYSMKSDRAPAKSRYSVINDNYKSLEEVQKALRGAGLESSNLIVGIDFTKSNEWTGKRSFGGRSLHAVGGEPNPYEKSLSIISTTLSPFDEDGDIPCFGFGDSTSHDKQVFSFFADCRPCCGMEEAVARYRAIVPHVRLAGPTSFAPIINAAVDIVEESGGQYHVLVIVADGQIDGPQELATVEAIVNASYYPLSIVLVGVGDGPWNMMREFDDNLPSRTFDNFQFINFTEIMLSNLPPQRKEAQFALAALMEIPQQYKATKELRILGSRRGTSPGMKPLLPPPKVLQMDGQGYGRPGAPQAPLMHMDSQNYGRPSGPPPPLMHMDSQNYGRPSGPSPPLRHMDSQNYGRPPPQVPTSIYNEYYTQPPPNAYGDYNNYGPPPSSAFAPAPQSSSYPPSRVPDAETLECPVCLTDRKDMAFNCGHQTCRLCATSLINCPICRQEITTRVRLY